MERFGHADRRSRSWLIRVWAHPALTGLSSAAAMRLSHRGSWVSPVVLRVPGRFKGQSSVWVSINRRFRTFMRGCGEVDGRNSRRFNITTLARWPTVLTAPYLDRPLAFATGSK